MIHVIGDSHALFSTRGIDGVVSHSLGPVSMRRLGYPEDTLLPDAVAALNLTAADVLLTSSGEGDVRCFIHPQLEHRKITADDLLGSMAERYATNLAALPTAARRGVLSVPPPAPYARAWDMRFPPGQLNVPPAGTDAERVQYARTLNAHLAQACVTRGLIFVDIFTPYATVDGLLEFALSDGCVHINVTDRVRAAFVAGGLL